MSFSFFRPTAFVLTPVIAAAPVLASMMKEVLNLANRTSSSSTGAQHNSESSNYGVYYVFGPSIAVIAFLGLYMGIRACNQRNMSERERLLDDNHPGLCPNGPC